jgi:hypothetical protein
VAMFCGHLVYFSTFWYVAPRKIWQPCFLQSNVKLSVSFFRVWREAHQLFMTQIMQEPSKYYNVLTFHFCCHRVLITLLKWF